MIDQENEMLWKSYFYPDTNVLINNLGIKDYDKLKKVESTHTFEKLLLLRQNSFNIELNKNGLNSLHKYLFGDIYPFAGEYRKMNMRRARGTFLEIDDIDDIDSSLDKLFREINKMLTECHSKMDFCNLLAKLYTSLIFIHPYREGNGRTVREFLREFSIRKSEELGIGQMELDWTAINRDELDEFIDVAHLFPDSISSIFMNALVSNDDTKIR